MMMKRLPMVCLLLVIAALFLALAACGTEDRPTSTLRPTNTVTEEPRAENPSTQTLAAATATPTDDQVGSEAADADDQIESTATAVPTEAQPEVEDTNDETEGKDPSGPEEPQTVYITAAGDGDFATLDQAVQMVPADSTILLDAGHHQLSGRLVITKSLIIQGEGVTVTTVSQSVGGSPIISFDADNLVIKDLALLRTGDYAGDLVKINGGEVLLENCAISGGAGTADESIKGHGVLLFNDTRATIRNCTIENNMGVGIGILDTVTAAIDRVTISNNKGGVIFSGEAQGEIVDSVFTENLDQAILVAGHAEVSVISNTIRHNDNGIVFHLEASGGEVLDNELAMNGASLGGVDIMVFENFFPTIEGNACDGRGQSFSGSDFNGIVFITRSSSPPDVRVLRNSCSVARCSTPTGSFLSMECN
jgi:hypothetical protein